MHAPDRLPEMFPLPSRTSSDTGFVTEQWYEPVYAGGESPEPPDA